MISYVVFVFFAGAASLRDASGNVADLLNNTVSSCAVDYSCKNGLANDYSVSGIFDNLNILCI